MSAIVSLGGYDENVNSTWPVIVVFPHAGGSPRFFSHWVSLLTGYRLWGVTYPGRDRRMDEQSPRTLQILAHDCARELDAMLGIQTCAVILVGHSLGAWIAWECACCLEKIAPHRKLMTIVSGQNPPDCSPGTSLHQASDDALVADMNRQNPANRTLWEHPELRQLFLPAVRDDYRLLETYRASFASVQDLTVIYGDNDSEIDRKRIGHWQTFSHHICRIKTLPGGHFYLAAPDVSLPQYLTECFPC